MSDEDAFSWYWRVQMVVESLLLLHTPLGKTTAWVARGFPHQVLVTSGSAFPADAPSGVVADGSEVEMASRGSRGSLSGMRYETAHGVALVFLAPGEFTLGRAIPSALVDVDAAYGGGGGHTLVHCTADEGVLTNVAAGSCDAFAGEGGMIRHDCEALPQGAGAPLLDHQCRCVGVHVSPGVAVPLGLVSAALGDRSPWRNGPPVERYVELASSVPRVNCRYRSGEMVELAERLPPGVETVVSVCGLPGVGKSYFTRHFADASATRGYYGVIAVVDCRRMVFSFEHIGDILKIEWRREDTELEHARRVVDELSEGKHGAVLLVFDHADEVGHGELERLRPRGAHCHTGYVSRDARAFPNPMALRSLTARQAMALLDARRPSECDAALVEAVGCLPLAVVTLGRFMRLTGRTAAETLAFLRRDGIWARPFTLKRIAVPDYDGGRMSEEFERVYARLGAEAQSALRVVSSGAPTDLTHVWDELVRWGVAWADACGAPAVHSLAMMAAVPRRG